MAEKDARGWQVGKSLTECLSHMQQHQISTDVTFVIASPDTANDSSRVPAHQFILSARSPVFEAMFSGDYVESSKDVTIVDSEPEPFREMLR
jgi:hypothetical protein